MDWAAVLRDIVLGLLVAGAFAGFVPKARLQTLFFAEDRCSRSCSDRSSEIPPIDETRAVLPPLRALGSSPRYCDPETRWRSQVGYGVA